MQDETDRKIGHVPEETLGIDLGLILKNLLITFLGDKQNNQKGRWRR
jgi:hypothetical protein